MSNFAGSSFAGELLGISDWMSIALTAAFGVAIFVVGQIVQRLLIEPVQELKRTLGRIAHAIAFHGCTSYAFVDDAGEHHDPHIQEVDASLRGLAAELRANRAVIPAYRVVAYLFRLPSQDGINRASRALYRWAVTLYEPGGGEWGLLQEIDDSLRLRVQYPEERVEHRETVVR